MMQRLSAEVVLRLAGHPEREVRLAADPTATVATLLRTLGRPGATAAIDGRPLDPDTPLAATPLRPGSRIEVGAAGHEHGPEPVEAPPRSGASPAAGARSGSGPTLELSVAAGPDAGGRWPLTAPLRVGRSPEATARIDDPTLSARHARVAPASPTGVLVEDLGSTNGTWHGDAPLTDPTTLPAGGALRLGATRLAVRRPTDDTVRPEGAPAGEPAPFNRPPRPPGPETPAQLRVPPAPDMREHRSALSLVMVLAPLALGGAMVAITGQWRYALFLLLSPVIALGTEAGRRRRAKRERTRAGRRRERELAELAAAVELAADQEAARRRQRLPDLAETVRRARHGATRLWERRPGDEDWLALRLGVAEAVGWSPPVDDARAAEADDARRVLGGAALRDAPVAAELAGGGLVGVVGPPARARAVGRALLLQAATHHGPADLSLRVCGPGEGWGWASWLPHARLDDGAPANGETEAVCARHDDAPDDRAALLVVDDVDALARPGSALRPLLAREEVSAVVLARRVDQLPAACEPVVVLDGDVDATVRWSTQAPSREVAFVADGMSATLAREAARALAGRRDLEQRDHRGLPDRLRLREVLDLDAAPGAPPAAARLQERWRRAHGGPPVARLGADAAGAAVAVDLVRDGPHALIGGTTGAGKSELLRTLVLGLAADQPPDRLALVLVDYKGGAAFDRCAQLPHVAGLVTDLDAQLGARVLASLEAELRHRERLLREADAADLAAYLAAEAPRAPLPRLVVVVDEFAALAAELPDVLDALVDVAQRGRSLGVHLVLATQRPSGAVTADIAANAGLRIALRVQDEREAQQLVDDPAPARISPRTPGRAVLRVGAEPPRLLQTAHAGAPVADDDGAPVRLAPRIDHLPSAPAGGAAAGAGDHAPTELDALVDAIAAAHAERGGPPPRRPWMPPLPARAPRAHAEGLAAAGEGLLLAIADQPEQQRWAAWHWDPGGGHLAVVGTVGAGATTTLRTVAEAVALAGPPADWHLHVVDGLGSGLDDLARLPHVGAVATDPETRRRLLRRLRRACDERRAGGVDGRRRMPRVICCIDGLGGLLAELAETGGDELDDLQRLLTEGPALGVSCAVTLDRPGALPPRLAGAVGARLVGPLADPAGHAALGLRPAQLPAPAPGRLVDAATAETLQVLAPAPLDDLLARLPAAHRGDEGGPTPIATLPERIEAAGLPPVRRAGTGALAVPFGLDDEELAPTWLRLPPGQHALVAGPAGSGRTTALVTLAQRLAQAEDPPIVVAVCPPGHPLHDEALVDACGPADALGEVLAAAATDARDWVVLADDVERVADDGGLDALVQAGRDGLHVVGAGRPEALRHAYGAWHRALRRDGRGLLLGPEPGRHADLLDARLPHRLTLPTAAGRGVLVADGGHSVVQVAVP